MFHIVVGVCLVFIAFGVFSVGGNLGVIANHNLKFKPDGGVASVTPDGVAASLPVGEHVLVQFSTSGVQNTLVFCGTNPTNGALLLDIHDVS